MNYMPHGHCFFWEPLPLYTSIIGNSLTSISYFLIPFLLFSVYRHRHDMQNVRIVLWFAIFILFCGIGHALKIKNIYFPSYDLSGIVDLITGVISFITLVLLYNLRELFIKIPTIYAHKKALKEIELK